MKRLMLVDPQSVYRAIRLATRHSREEHVLHQLHCVMLVGLGHTCREVAGWFGDSTRTIERWVVAFNQQGAEGLGPHQAHGRPSRLAPDAAERLTQELTRRPFACGYAEPDWNGRLVMAHLIAHHGIHLSLRQSQRMLRRLRAERISIAGVIRQQFGATNLSPPP